ncbi:MAG: putative metal-binding motif-containing protein [Myxococcota bacterium]
MVWIGWGLMACGLFGLFERDPSRVDADRDGAPASIDCDDEDPERAPGLGEVCDGIDNDCDGLVDGDDTDSPPVGLATFFADRDADGFGDPAIPAFSCTRPAGFVEDGTDCDDTDENRAPGLAEVCDGLDNDCDALVDDADLDTPPSGLSTWYADADEDGFGNPDDVVQACAAPEG